MPSRQAQLQEDTAYRVMRLLEHNPDLTQRELAQQMSKGQQICNIMFSNKKRSFFI